MVQISSAGLQQTAPGTEGALRATTLAVGSTATISAVGLVTLQASGAGPGYALSPYFNPTAVVQGLYCRGFSAVQPTVAGAVGEYFVAQPPTATVTGWRCTTTGSASGGAGAHAVRTAYL